MNIRLISRCCALALALAQALAEENGDGRRSFVSQVRDIEAGGEDDDDDEDEAEEDED